MKFQLNPGVNHTELSNETFTYTLGLVPSPGGQPLTSNTTSYVMFTRSTASECQGGRIKGPLPSVTDERQGMRCFCAVLIAGWGLMGRGKNQIARIELAFLLPIVSCAPTPILHFPCFPFLFFSFLFSSFLFLSFSFLFFSFLFLSFSFLLFSSLLFSSLLFSSLLFSSLLFSFLMNILVQGTVVSEQRPF